VSAAELSFDLPGSGHVLFTTRAHGNLSSVGGVDAEHGLQAREQLRRQIGVERLQRGYQVHGTTVQRVRGLAPKGQRYGAVGLEARAETELVSNLPPDSTAQPSVEADGQATDLRGLGAIVLTADCLPVALGADGAVAIVHAGWRGLAEGVLEEGVRAVRELGAAGEMVAIVGPGAGPCCYEVGEEVHAVFGGAHRAQSPPPIRNIDLKAIARDRLLAAGVEEVRDVGICTICDERFFSYRREGARAGRQGAVAWLS
jgi:YfiH family protein